MPRARKASLASGTVFEDRYEIVSALDSGGFGEVYRARQRTTGQVVALKVIHSRLEHSAGPDNVYYARFLREMRVCARLNHPNIVPLVDSGQTPEGELYTVFAFVPGTDLGRVLYREGTLSLAETVHVMSQVLDALAAAHKEGVVHRDLKPANIMLTTSGARRNATVLDFGIGAFVDAEEQDPGRLTGTGEIIGTPRYAPPEQVQGEDPSPRSDLYAWGLVFVECLTGRPVMDGKTVQAVLVQQLDPTPVALPDVLRSHPAAGVLSQVLVKDVERRNVTAEGVLSQLERVALPGASASTEWTADPLGGTELLVGGQTQARPPSESRAGRSRATPTPASAPFPTPTPGSLPPSGPASGPAPTPSQPVSRSTPTSSEGERRLITAVGIVLGVVCGEEEEEEVGLEELDEALGGLQGLCREVAERFGGYVSNLTHDGALLFFGYPTAAEDDAVRAVRAALDLLGRVDGLAEAAPEAGPFPEATAGIHTGLVIARPASSVSGGVSDVVGRATIVASQLAASGEPGSVLLTEQTRELVGADFDLEPDGKRRLRGVPRPVEAFRVTGEAASRTSGSLVGREETPLVGREHELALLRQRWSVSRDGAGESVLVSGEAGIGKSRLARELIRDVRRGHARWLACHCIERSQQAALRPVAGLLEGLIGLEEGQTAGDRLRRLERFLDEHGFELDEHVPLLAPVLAIALEGGYRPLNVSPEEHKQLTFDTVVSLLFELSEDAPLLLLVEDLHWADSATLELLGILVEEIVDGAIFLLLTARPEFSAPWTGARVTPIRLGRLAREQIALMVGALAGGETVTAEVIDLVARRTDGVSLFVEELTRTLVDGGHLVEGAGGLVLSGTLSEEVVPSSLRGLLTARLDRLGRAQSTAQLAAAIGREFSLELLAAVSPLDEAALREDLGALADADLLRRQRRRRARQYSFKHALTRDTAYGSLLAATRKRTHGEIARAIEERFPDLAASRPDLLVYHHAEAGDRLRALDFARAAARAALARSANHEAFRLASGAREWVEALEDPPEAARVELELHAVLLPALMTLKGYVSTEFAEAAQRAVVLVETVGDSPHMTAALFALLLYQHRPEYAHQALGMGEMLVAQAEVADDSGALGVALALVARCYLTDGDLGPAREAAERASALYDRGSHASSAVLCGVDFLVWARTTLAQVASAEGDPDRALELCREAVEHARALKHTHSLATALLAQAEVHQAQGAREDTEEVATELQGICERHHMTHQGLVGGLLRAWATDDLEAARRAVLALQEGGPLRGTSCYLALLAEVLANRGEAEAASARLDEALRFAEEHGERLFEAGLRRLQGSLAS